MWLSHLHYVKSFFPLFYNYSAQLKRLPSAESSFNLPGSASQEDHMDLVLSWKQVVEMRRWLGNQALFESLETDKFAHRTFLFLEIEQVFQTN